MSVTPYTVFFYVMKIDELIRPWFKYAFLLPLGYTEAKKIPEKLIYRRHLEFFFKTKFAKKILLAKTQVQEYGQEIFKKMTFHLPPKILVSA